MNPDSLAPDPKSFARAQQWLQRHDAIIPALAINHTEIIELLEDENQSHNLVNITARDPGIAFALLKRVNIKRGPKSRREPIESPQAGAALLGDTALRSMLRNFQVAEKNLTDPQQLFLFHQLENRALHNEFQATRWAENCGYKQLEPIRVAALLAYIGETLCCLYDYNNYLDYIHGKLITVRQTQSFGFTFDELTAAVVRKYHLPALIGNALPSSSERDPRAQLLQYVSAIDHACEQGWRHDAVQSRQASLAQLLSLPVDRVASQTHQFAVAAARETRVPEAWQPASRLVLSDDSSWISPARQQVAAKPHARREAEPKQHQPKSDHKPSLQTALRSLQTLLKDPEVNQPRILHACIDALHHDLALSKVSLLLLNRQQGLLQARLASGIDKRSPLHGYQVELARAGLFKVLLEKPQAIWSNRQTFAKYHKHIPNSFIAATMANDFFAMSLFVGNRAVGIVYADKNGTSEALSQELFAQFKQLVVFSSKALTLVAKRKQSTKT